MLQPRCSYTSLSDLPCFGAIYGLFCCLNCCHFRDFSATGFAPFFACHTTLGLVASLMITLRYALDIAGVFRYGHNPGPASMALCLLIDGSGLIALGLNGGRTAAATLHDAD